jgi:hypothetical protein
LSPSVDPLTELSITGIQDSANKIYTLSSQLSIGSQHMFFINGQLMTYNNDYIISANTLLIYTHRPAPSKTDILRIFGSIGTVPISGVSNSLSIAYSIALG